MGRSGAQKRGRVQKRGRAQKRGPIAPLKCPAGRPGCLFLVYFWFIIGLLLVYFGLLWFILV